MRISKTFDYRSNVVHCDGEGVVIVGKIDKEKGISRIEITIHEGKNRQVRKMCNAIGRKVLALHRSKIGNVEVRDMKIGTWRYLNKKEVEEILN